MPGSDEEDDRTGDDLAEVIGRALLNGAAAAGDEGLGLPPAARCLRDVVLDECGVGDSGAQRPLAADLRFLALPSFPEGSASGLALWMVEISGRCLAALASIPEVPS